MKTKTLLFLFALLTLPFALFGADTADSTLPQTNAQYWDLAIAAVAPLIVTGIKNLAPKIPKWLLPTITPLIGVGLGLGLNALTKANLSWVDMAKAGALAVFVRETFNQVVTQKMQAGPSGSPPTP